MIGINRLLMRGGIIVDDVRIDTDSSKRLAQIIAELFRFVEIGCGQKPQREARAILARL